MFFRRRLTPGRGNAYQQYEMRSPNLGFIGILLNIPKEDMNDQTAEALRKELDLLSKKMSEITSTAVPAPAQ